MRFHHSSFLIFLVQQSPSEVEMRVCPLTQNMMTDMWCPFPVDFWFVCPWIINIPMLPDSGGAWGGSWPEEGTLDKSLDSDNLFCRITLASHGLARIKRTSLLCFISLGQVILSIKKLYLTFETLTSVVSLSSFSTLSVFSWAENDYI